jgi:hypothetical protein
MQNAKKLSLTLPKIDINTLELLPDSGESRHVLFEDRAGVTRFKLPKTLSEEILSCLPIKFRSFVFCINFSHIRSAVPHFHTYDESVINYYLETEDYETTFYEKVNNTNDVEEKVEFPEEGLIQVVDINSVQPIEKFIAQSGDIYLLNSKAVHSVSQVENTLSGYDKYRPVREEKRLAIQIWTKCPFRSAYYLLS